MNLSEMPVQKKPCNTCPFAGANPVQLSEARYRECIENLVGFQPGQHLCHSADNEKICRGGRDIQLRYFYAIGVISKPTDEAFQEAVEKNT